MGSVPDQRGLWDFWHAAPHDPDPEPLHRRFTERFIEKLPPAAEGSPILELGCGQGHDAVLIASYGYSVCGLDFSAVAVEQARKSGESHPGLKIGFLRHDTADPLPFRTGAFGGVYSYLSLHYFTDSVTRRVFREIGRVLRPGGIFAFCVKSTSDPLWGKGIRLERDMFSLDGHVRHFFDRDYVRCLLASWGILLLEEHRAGYLRSNSLSGMLHVIARRPDNFVESGPGEYAVEES